jgi:hypothetical protein
MNSYLSELLVGLLAVCFSCKKEVGPPPVDPIEQFGIDLGLIDASVVDNYIQAVIIRPASNIRYTNNEIGAGVNPEKIRWLEFKE